VVDRPAIAHNFKVFRSYIPQTTKLLAVVKSNAYGHGLVDFAKEMEALGVDWLGVDSIVEALALRREGVKTPIVVLGYTLPERIDEAIRNHISVSLSNFEQIPIFAKHAVTAPLSIHIKVDTGMHRQGFLPEDQPRLLKELRKHKKQLLVEGLFTHFASAKNPAFPHYTKKQIAEFDVWRDTFADAGYTPLVHAGATAGTILFPEAHLGMVRIGIGLYGLWPASEVERSYQDRLTLKPALSWKTIISEIKSLPKGEKIGYDGTETLSRQSQVAVCPVGYWHGYPRALSSIGYVLVKGKRARVLGRVSMDMITIDITGISGVRSGDEVTLIGHDGEEEISAKELASAMDGSYYELLTRINPLVKRIYV
jgi:alanine racemase